MSTRPNTLAVACVRIAARGLIVVVAAPALDSETWGECRRSRRMRKSGRLMGQSCYGPCVAFKDEAWPPRWGAYEGIVARRYGKSDNAQSEVLRLEFVIEVLSDRGHLPTFELGDFVADAPWTGRALPHYNAKSVALDFMARYGAAGIKVGGWSNACRRARDHWPVRWGFLGTLAPGWRQSARGVTPIVTPAVSALRSFPPSDQ